MQSNEESRNKLSIKVECATYHDGNIWFIASISPYLYRMNLSNNEVKRVAKIMNDNENSTYMYYSLAFVDESIFMIPWASKNIAVYDINNNAVQYYELEKKYENNSFCGAIITDKYIFSFCPMEPIVIRINRSDVQISYCDLSLNTRIDGDYYFGTSAAVVNEKIFFPLRNSNRIIEMDIDSMEYIVHILPEDCNSYYGIEHLKTGFIITPEKSKNPIIYLNDGFKITQRIKTVGGNNSPISVYYDENEYFFSLDKNIKISDKSTMNYHHGFHNIEKGFLAYSEKRDMLMVHLTGDKDLIKPMWIPFERDILRETVRGCVINEESLSLCSFIEIVGGNK